MRLTTRGDFSEASDHAGVAVCQSEHAEALTGGVAAEQLSAAEQGCLASASTASAQKDALFLHFRYLFW